jgi:hypothetical protein
MTGGATNDPEAQGNPMNGVELSARSISRDAIVVDCLTARDQLHCWRLLQNKHSTHLAQCLSPKSSVSGAYLLLLAGAALTKLIVGPAFYSNRLSSLPLSLSLSLSLLCCLVPSFPSPESLVSSESSCTLLEYMSHCLNIMTLLAKVYEIWFILRL